MNKKVILNSDFPKLNLVKKGKVRDIYDLDDYYLIVSTDRLSAFDVIMNQGIPFKGIVLNTISEFWFNFTRDIIPNHLITTNVSEYPPICRDYSEELHGRSMIVKKAEVLPVEIIIRGYISGSGWKDYKETGMISGIKLKENLKESDKIDESIFTPSTKAEIGDHDENISEAEAEKIIGENNLKTIKSAAINIFKKAGEYALSKEIIIADTKMEFGILDGDIILVDELLTPDSSRFWPSEKYEPGRTQESFDKQFVRDYLLSINFNKQPPPPDLPDEIIQKTSQKYLEALKLLTGKSINAA